MTFHVLLFAYVRWRIEPALGWQRRGPLFSLTVGFFNESLKVAGGLLDYCARALAQLDHSSLGGALAFAGLASLVFLVTRLALARLACQVIWFAAFLPALLLLAVRQSQGGQVFTAGLGYVLGLGLALAFDRMPQAQLWPRLVACTFLSALLCAGAGFWPCALFVAGVAVFGIRWHRTWMIAVTGLFAGIATGIGMTMLGGQDLATLFNPWGSRLQLALTAGVFLCPALMLLTAVLVTRRASSNAAKMPQGARGVSPPGGWNPRRPRLVQALVAGLIAATATGVWSGFDRQEHTLALIEYAAHHGDYPRVLAAAATLESLPPPAEVRLHRALFHTGRLLDDLFACPNQTQLELLPGVVAGPEACRAQAETLLELGQVSEAEHLAHEALELEGDRPDLLRLLAEINILKDRPEAARVFLGVLRRSPNHRAQAETLLTTLRTDPRQTNDARLATVRSRLVTTDLPHDGMPTETLLKQLLHSNARNRMAFEYLLAHYLLTRELPRFAARLPQTDGFRWTSLPRHCEEAVLLHQRFGGHDASLSTIPIRAETRRRFEEFTAALEHGAIRSAEGREALASTFGGTYWYFFLTHPPEQTAAAPLSK